MDGKGKMNKTGKKVRLGTALGLVLLALLLLAEAGIHRHPHFAVEEVFGFFALLGVGAVVALALLARLLEKLLKRGEDLYDG